MGRIIANRYAEIANTRRVGGQSEVFKAADLHQGGRQVAVKIVPATTDDINRIYFERETSALRKLSHPNIASLIDSGTDIESGLYYVVLNWVDQTISDWLASFSEPPGWDDIAEVIALPLASALAHSHAMSVLHRDIKPNNVLWNETTPLLADFALSKIKDQVSGAADATVVGMTSPPWAPPDQTSRGSARFDVYGLAATLLQCVTGSTLRDYPDIPRALEGADVPPEVLQLLRDALSTDPDRRPADGQVFHLALQTIQTKRSARWHKQKEIAFELTGAARRSLESGCEGQSAEAVIAARMGTATYAVPRLKDTGTGGAALTAEEFRLVGDQIECKLAFSTPQKLTCIYAEVKDFEQLEHWRRHENAVTLDGRDFAWSASRPANPRQSALATNELHTLLAKAVQDAGDEVSDRFKEIRLTNWSALIDAKEQLERRLEEPIRYRRVGRSGMEFEIEATNPQTGAVLDQERLARPLDEPTSRGVSTTIVDVDGQSLTVRINRPGADLPASGVLVRDRTPSHAAIRRQKSALSALREGSAARPHLRELVLDPMLAAHPQPVSFVPTTAGLDDDKKAAVANALGSTDLFLVEGPPGTGKTSFICELINQYLAARPDDKVLLVSQMHVAIDNAITRLHRSGVTSVVRLSSRDDNVDPDAIHMLLSNKLRDWAAEVAERARIGMSLIAEREGIAIEHLSLALSAEEASSTIRQRSETSDALGPLDADDRLDNEDLDEERAAMLADYLRSADRADEAIAEVRSAATALGIEVPDRIDESALQSLVADLLGGRSTDHRLRELMRAQGDWLASLNDPASAEPMFLPTQSVVAGTCMGFLANPNIQEMQFDLCIIDEASRATAPELLVPMTRAKRWVMVGDTKQLPPLVEEVFEHRDLVDTFELDKAFLTASLFDILIGEAPDECKSGLVTQHRMAVPIGELISSIFYDGALIHDPAPMVDPDTVNPAERLVWFSTSRRSNRHEESRHSGSSSSSNKLEAEHVAKLVKRVDDDISSGSYRRLDGEPLEVLVLTGYLRQRTEIERAVRRLTLTNIEPQIKTVDAVQGREADVVIFSVTRSNLAGDLGFLGERFKGRLNVALSRAREVLWIVGDSDFSAGQEGPLRRVLGHIASVDAGKVEYL